MLITRVSPLTVTGNLKVNSKSDQREERTPRARRSLYVARRPTFKWSGRREADVLPWRDLTAPAVCLGVQVGQVCCG